LEKPLSQEELSARMAAVRAHYRKEPTPEQAAEHAEAISRKAAGGGGKPKFGKDEFEESLIRALAKFMKPLEGCARHHKRSFTSSPALQDFASLFDEVRGVTHEVEVVVDEIQDEVVEGETP